MLLDANVATADGATGRLLLSHRATQAIGDPKASTNSASVFASINGQRKQDA